MTKSEQIAASLIDDIQKGKYAGKIPSERELARIYDTTPVTAAKALNFLQKKHLVVRKRGNGTFINDDRGGKTTIRFSISNCFIGEEIKKCLVDHFPEYSFVFPGSANLSALGRFESNDLIWHSGSVLPGSYDKLCRTLPLPFVLSKMNDPSYSGDTFKIHRSYLHYYGVPVLFSPMLLVFNKTLLKHFSLPTIACAPTLEQNLEMNQTIDPVKNYCLFNIWDMRLAPFMDALITCLPPGNSSGGVSWDELKTALETVEELYRFSIRNKADFRKGNVVFDYQCRQTIEVQLRGKVDFAWDVLPMNSKGGASCAVASESCFISATSLLGDDVLTPILEYLLSDEVQGIIGKRHFGIPVLKSAAFDSMRKCDFRDDYFFSEIPNVMFENRIFDKDLLWMLDSYIHDHFGGEIGFDEFIANMEDLFKINKMRRKASDAIEHHINMRQEEVR